MVYAIRFSIELGSVVMSMSLLGVSSVHLLEAFVNASSVTTEHMTKMLIIHLVFVASTIVIAYVNHMGRTAAKQESAHH